MTINEWELQVLGDAHNIMVNGKGKLPKNTYTMISFKQNPKSWETKVCGYCKEKEKNNK